MIITRLQNNNNLSENAELPRRESVGDVMTHWFHRNPLKATVPVKFDGLRKCGKGEKCSEIVT